MVTDTALFRYPAYHTAEDTPEKLDYDRMARVTAGGEMRKRVPALTKLPASTTATKTSISRRR